MNDYPRYEIKINGQTASKRTRVRVKDNKNQFALIKHDETKRMVLVRGEVTGWFGWLPMNEVKIKPIR